MDSIDGGGLLFKDFIKHYYPMGREILHHALPVEGFFYPAFFGLLMAPLGLLSPTAAFWAWMLIQIGCFLALCYLPGCLLLRLSPWQSILYPVLCLTSFPVLHNFRWGQISALVTALVFAAFGLHAAGKPILSGILLGLATSMKLYPALFLPYFILKRDLRWFVAFATSLLGFYVFLPAAVLGPGHWLDFKHAVRIALAETDWFHLNVNSQYIVHVGTRWSELVSRHVCPVRISPEILRVAGYGIAGLILAAIWRLRRQPVRSRLSLSLAALSLTTPFIIKTSWPHYFVYLPFCQMVMLASFSAEPRGRRARNRLLQGAVLISTFLSSVLGFLCFSDWGRYNMMGMLFLANALLVAPLCAIAFSKSLPPVLFPQGDPDIP